MNRLRMYAAAMLLLFLAGCTTEPELSLEQRQREIWDRCGMTSSVRGPVGEAHFLRRVHLDLTGLPPDPDEITAFLLDQDPEKRVKLVERLLRGDPYAVYQAHLWGDELRIKAEFPINLWPNAVQFYSRYVYIFCRDNIPYDRFAREVLTASGSNFRVAPANFFRAAADRSPKGLAEVTSLTFFGRHLDSFSQRQQRDFIAFFTRIGYKSSREWKEEFVFCKYPPPGTPLLRAAVPGRARVIIPADTDPRTVLAEEILASDMFADAMVCRVWRRLFGREPSDPRLTTMRGEMARRFRASGFDIRKLYREILLSPAYSLPPGTPKQEKVFAAYPVRRLNAEQISDRISALLKHSFENYSSVIPEPFTFLPPGTRAGAIDDGSISSAFLDLMGKPPRDSGSPEERRDNLTGKQKLFFLNSGKLYNELRQTPNRWYGKRDSFNLRISKLYLAALSRPETAEELALCRKYFNLLPPRERWKFWHELLWALVNSKEFLYQF